MNMFQNFQNLGQLFKSMKNPKQFVLNMVKQNNNPVFNNLIDMANKNDIEGIKKFGQNLFKEQNRDFDKEFNDFMNTFKN